MIFLSTVLHLLTLASLSENSNIVNVNMMLNGSNTNKNYSAKDSVCIDKSIKVFGKAKCSYCIKLINILQNHEYDFDYIDITNNKNLHGMLKGKTGISTVPYVYINNEYIGGYTDFMGKCYKKGI